MKKLFLLLSVVSFLSAQEVAEYNVNEAVEEQERSTALNIIRENIIYAVQHGNVELLKQSLNELGTNNQFIYADNITPYIKASVGSPFKAGITLGACGALLIKNIYDLKDFRTSEKSVFSLIMKSLLNAAILRVVVYLVQRKNYQIINMLIDDNRCCKFPRDAVLLEQLRRQCVPFICCEQEELFKLLSLPCNRSHQFMSDCRAENSDNSAEQDADCGEIENEDEAESLDEADNVNSDTL